MDLSGNELERICFRLKQIAPVGSIRQEIVMLVAKGKPRKVIAAELGRSPHTISDHIKEIYRFTGVSDRLLLALTVNVAYPPLIRGVVRNR